MLSKLFPLICMAVILMNISSVYTFGSEDTKYYQTFKGIGKVTSLGGHNLPSSGSESPTAEFYGAIKRVIKKDKDQGMELYFFVWEQKLRTWSPGFFIGSSQISQQQMISSPVFLSELSVRHFGDQELNPVTNGNSDTSQSGFILKAKDNAKFNLADRLFPSTEYSFLGAIDVKTGKYDIDFDITDI